MAIIQKKITYSYLCQLKPYTDEMEALHIVPYMMGLHWCEDGICWCHPECSWDGKGHWTWLHRNYQPKWGS